MGAAGCRATETFWSKGCLGLGVLDMVGIVLTSCLPAEEGGTGIGGTGRG